MIQKVSELSTMGVIDLTEVLNALSKGIISRVALGKCLEESHGVRKLIEETTLLGAFHWGDYFPWLAWMSRVIGLDARVRRAFEEGN